MAPHLDNASILVDSLLSGFGWRFLQSYPLIHSFCKLLGVKALFKWIRISAYYCEQFSSPCDLGCVPSFMSGEQSNQANDKASTPWSLHQQYHVKKLNCQGQPLFTPCCYWVKSLTNKICKVLLSPWIKHRSHFVHCHIKYNSGLHLKDKYYLI